MPAHTRTAVVGGGWAGLAAAVEATRLGQSVTLFEMASRLGGRARSVDVAGLALDNGQHILIGAYVETLALMRRVGVDLEAALLRSPLRLVDAHGVGLRLDAGAPSHAFMRAVLRQRGWRWRERLALLAATARWRLGRFRCPPSLTVAALTRGLPIAVRDDLIDPLCVAALNTPSNEASAQVFLRVLKDALLSGPGSADLLLPRIDLGALLPGPAGTWLQQAGARLRLAQRVGSITPDGADWQLDGEPFDRVVLATPPREAARLARDIAPDWARQAEALRYEPIVTVYLHGDQVRLPEPMLALRPDAASPAQFVFDRGQLGGPAGLLAFVISGAQPWVDRGSEAIVEAVQRQASETLGAALRGSLRRVQTVVEKRATFRCTPALERPAMRLADGLHAAGDYVDGPYPATLEGAVRSGLGAARSSN
ncbi:MAG: hydroxysqualene dehydroxylase HpnE [Burkholderiaceae bacterium]